MISVRLPMLVLVAGGLAVCSSSWQAPAWAQEPGQQAPTESSVFNEGTLRAFAQAKVDVQSISKKYQSKISGADSADSQRQLDRARMDAMINAVTEAGLTVQQYNEIQRAYNNNARIAAAIDSFIEEAQ